MKRFGLSADRRRLVYSGRLVSVKRVDLLIDAFIRVAADRPNWDLLIIGDGPLRSELEERIPIELRSRAIWTGHLDDQPAIGALYRMSDVLVLPSDYEPWALVLNEAAAAGLAIVCSHVVGASAELVREGVNGWTFPKGNLGALVDRLMEVTSPQHIDTMKGASPLVLDDWRKVGDPIDGLRKALRSAGVIAARTGE
jgi:glycosyltransferase involved in cell wall biosynthesis